MQTYCRSCRAPKWRHDPCTNADCPRNNRTTTRLKSRSLPITANVKHGFHATMSVTRLVDDYDLPIRAKGWKSRG